MVMRSIDVKLKYISVQSGGSWSETFLWQKTWGCLKGKPISQLVDGVLSHINIVKLFKSESKKYKQLKTS